MLVSVIISNYNYGAYVSAAIESVLNQTYQPIEVIVVDDGSTDHSRSAIESFGDRIVPLFKPNGGHATTYNVGWERARGDIVLFLDADDVLLPEAVAKCVAALRGTDNVKAQFMLQQVNEKLQPIGGVMPTYGLRPSNIHKEMLQWGYYLSPPASGNAYSRAFLETVMPAPEEKVEGKYDLAPDGYLCGVAGLSGKIVTLYEILGQYRVHGANDSAAGKVTTVSKLRYLFMIDYLREQYQMRWAEHFGVAARPDRSVFHPGVCKQRLLTFRLQPEGHPVPNENYWRLLGAGLWGSMTFPYLPLAKRGFIFVGFLAIGMAPLGLLARLIGSVSKPQDRFRLKTLFASRRDSADSQCARP